MPEPINLDHFQNEFFREAINAHALAYASHFDDRLITIYAWGSVHRNEAVPHVSDIDLHVFLNDPLTEQDIEWGKVADRQMNQAFPETCGMSRPRPVHHLLKGKWPNADASARIRTNAFVFRFHYDATRIWGPDLIQELNLKIPEQRGDVQTHRALVRHAAGLEKENPTDYRLPKNPSLRLRKLARIGVLGGAERLKSQGKFRSYKGSDVLPVLKASLPEWTAFLDKTDALYLHPADPAETEVAEYLHDLVEWLDWLHMEIGFPRA